ncbi:hypothetical protein CROQUDRAFT_89983 [Cronartium quercuum f. sp. fusiforme G11]|uniref:Uncharacterized protein n=1 Tax=Cronartium quercuum f. sp. fusiforme G11 TaxID=708437 RepID=A0A9P6NQZ2_9BASI|nr:hypothetical protein CROQUDRAFT_89983 [Cronartium quercuum f. sp. fusiforme G11]
MRPPSTTSSSSTISPQVYLHQLAQLIQHHQSALAATASQSRTQSSYSGSSQSGSNSWNSLSALTTGFGLLSSSPPSPSPRTLSLDPHHLYYLLLKFEEIGLQPGPLDVSLNQTNLLQTGLRSYDPTLWMKGFNPSEKGKPIDISETTSLFSNISNISLGSNWWTGTSTVIGNLRGQRSTTLSPEEEVKYLYSTFTKLPSLRLSPTSSLSLTTDSSHQPEPMQLLEGFTDLPNGNGVPLICFKSLWTLSIHDLDPRHFIGWNRLSQSLRSLEIRRSGLEDIERLLIDAVMSDVEREVKIEINQKDLIAEQQEFIETNDDDEHNKKKKIMTDELTTSPTELNPPISPKSTTFPALAWRFLHHLCLADNALTFIPPNSLVALVSLVSLDLSSNLLNVVPPGLSSLTRLKSLNLAGNMIDSVLGIYQSLGNVTTINLSRNRLTSLCGLERLYSIERLDIRQNQINDIKELSRLATLPSLTSLWTSSNPFINLNVNDWRIIIFNYFALEKRDIDLSYINLTLDNFKPTYTERKLINFIDRSTSINDNLPSTIPKPIILRNSPRRSRTTTATTLDVTSSSEETGSPRAHRIISSKKDKSIRRRPPRIIELDNQHQHPSRASSSNLSSSLASPSFHNLAPDENFRRKIEALRDEVGDGWLRVLSESEFGDRDSDNVGQER